MLTVPCLRKKEQLHLDLFLFSYYTGGMANVDVCNLTWDLVQEDRIVYERIKFPKTAKPELLSKAKAIMNKYRGQSYGNYVFPVFTHKHTTTSKKTTRVKQISTRLSQTLTKACKMLRIKENITWYSARGSFISKMVDAGNNPYVVAEMAGNSPLTIYKHYYKNTKREGNQAADGRNVLTRHIHKVVNTLTISLMDKSYGIMAVKSH